MLSAGSDVSESLVVPLESSRVISPVRFSNLGVKTFDVVTISPTVFRSPVLSIDRLGEPAIGLTEIF